MYGIPMTYYEHWYAYRIGSHEGENWYYSALAVDILFGIGLTIVFGCIVEWLISMITRRREMDSTQ